MSLLIKTALYNNFSAKFKSELEAKIKSYGKVVRYKFHISRENPDPVKQNGKVIYPGIWSLTPAIYRFKDPNVSDAFSVALILTQDEKGIPTRFKKIQVEEGEKGVLSFNTEEDEDMDRLIYLELHPKNGSSDYKEKSEWYPFERIDELKVSNEQREARSIRKKAMDIAEKMSDAEVAEFADAMMWDKALEPEVVRNLVEDMAENNSQFFLDNANSKKTKLQSLVRRAREKKIIDFNAGEYSFSFSGNKQVIAILSPAGEKGENEKMAEWLLHGDAGKKAADKLFELAGK